MQVASRRLSGDGTTVLKLPQSPPLAAMSAVVLTVSETAASACIGASRPTAPTAVTITALEASRRRARWVVGRLTKICLQFLGRPFCLGTHRLVAMVLEQQV